jgi:hypothetical protein
MPEAGHGNTHIPFADTPDPAGLLHGEINGSGKKGDERTSDQRESVSPELRVLESLAQAAEDAARRGGSRVKSREVLDRLGH